MEIARGLDKDYQFEGLAYRLLHKAGEEYLMRIYKDCALVASLQNRVTVDERDMLVVRHISGDYGKFNTWGTGYQQHVQEERMEPGGHQSFENRLQEPILPVEGGLGQRKEQSQTAQEQYQKEVKSVLLHEPLFVLIRLSFE